MQNNKTYLSLMFGAVMALSACTQTTPSMMNTSRVELSRETKMEQIPLEQVNDANMKTLAYQYHKYGSGPIDLVMTFDPKSKEFTAMRAVHTLNKVQSTLKRNGVKNMSAETMAVPEGNPSLLVSFDTVTAHAPSECDPMPGMEYLTDRELGNYQFGCGVETAFAKQIARPADLEGNSEMGSRSARRDGNIIEGYSAGEPRPALHGIERADLATE